MPVDPNFEKIVRATQTFAEKAGAGTRNDGQQRPWMNYKAQGGAGKFDFEAVHKVFDRKAGNDFYVKARSEGTAKGKDIHLPKISVDFLAGMERDFRMRTRSRVRMFIHTAARVSANGQDNGPLRRNTVDWTTAIFKEEAKKAT